MKNYMVLMAILLAPATSFAEDLVIEGAQLTLIGNVNLSAQIAGYVEHVPVKPGDRVNDGDTIAQLNDDLVASELVAAMEERHAAEVAKENDVDFRYAQKSRDVAEQELMRSQRANQRFPKTVSDSELQRLKLTVDQTCLAAEQAQRDLETADAKLSSSEANVNAVQNRLMYHRIVAPSSGTVVQVDVQPGSWVNPGDAVARVIRLDKLRVAALVDGNQHAEELVGRSLTFHPTNGTEEATGTIVFVSPELHPVTGRVLVWGEVSNEDRALRPGFKGSLTIHDN